MELLIFLLERREQMVSRDDIVKKLWLSDLFIDTEKNVNNVVRKLRTALGDNADRPRFLETVVGKGYRFVGPVRVIDAKYPLSDSGRSSVRSDRRKDGSERGKRSSIAVLPLLLLEKATDDQGLCLGFADALVSLLGNLSGLDVLPTSAVLNLPLELTPSQIASRLASDLSCTAPFRCPKGSDVSHWRCLTHFCSAPAARRSATRTWIALRVSRAILPSRSAAR
jgi:DNA-binding winged helix-turn-helix (wHTH) protein